MKNSKSTTKQRLLMPYINPGISRTISHITRVNSIGRSSKIIFPRNILSTLDLDWEDDYVEWKIETRNGEKMAIMKKFNVLSNRKTTK